MYTGTLISDLMTTVERVGQVGGTAAHRTEERELHEIFHDADSIGQRVNRFSWGQHNGGSSGDNVRSAIPVAERRSFWTGTPEIYFSKAIDNSRLVKVEDPRRNREMKQFGTALACLFLLVFTYAWQHFKAIEYGYQIESAKRELSETTLK